MSERTFARVGLSVVSILAAVAVVSWDRPAAADPAIAAPGDADCTFAIYAQNNLSFDVRVWLYDSSVMFPTVMSKDRQLKIQNHRIASGKTMDRRYTDTGRCDRNRNWTFYVQRGSGSRLVLWCVTGGTKSASRTLDLGPASRWTDGGKPSGCQSS